MTRRSITVWMAGLAVLGSASLLGAYALQARQLEREIAALPLVQLDPVVITAGRATVDRTSTRVATTPTHGTLR